MYRLLLISLLFVFFVDFGSVVALSDVNQQCIAENSEPFSNDNLLGTWYMIWKFTLFGGMIPSSSCIGKNFTRPTAEVIQEYKNKYNDSNLPYNIDDNPVLVTNGYTDGMVFGHNIAKFYVLDPKTSMILNWDRYKVDAYRLLTPKYIMYTECSLRGFTRWLLTTDRHAPVSEIQELIKNTPELNKLDQQRYCATY